MQLLKHSKKMKIFLENERINKDEVEKIISLEDHHGNLSSSSGYPAQNLRLFQEKN